MLQPKVINSNLPIETKLKIVNDNIQTLFTAVSQLTSLVDSMTNHIAKITEENAQLKAQIAELTKK
jgi:outer membrane murein-binding lipoprotein Lpp